MGQTGELHADQAHRGYNGASDEAGYAALNPLYMRCVCCTACVYGVCVCVEGAQSYSGAMSDLMIPERRRLAVVQSANRLSACIHLQ